MSFDFSKLVAIGQTVSALFPVITNTVSAVEAALPAGSNGQQKLAVVQQTLQGVFNAVSDIAVTFEQAWPALNAVVTAVVAAYNAAGIFKKSAG